MSDKERPPGSLGGYNPFGQIFDNTSHNCEFYLEGSESFDGFKHKRLPSRNPMRASLKALDPKT